MGNDYLSIARNFKTNPTNNDLSCEKSEISEISTVAGDAADYLSEREQFHQALGIQEVVPGDRNHQDHKATITGGVPPYEAALVRQEWLAGLDWRYGLRCGIDGHQCRQCKGIPCRGSTEWPHG